MKFYACRVCGNPLYAENSLCVSCGTALGYSREERDIVPLDAEGRYVDAAGLVWHVCVNLNLSGCTWLAPLEGGQCWACDLTRTRPNDDDLEGLQEFPAAEQAKRHLLIELDTLGVTVVGKDVDPDNGLAFDLLSSVDENVVIGHADGVITIDLAESDDAYREQVRAKLAEPYRTMLGHFRHEFGHYAQWQLVTESGDAAREARCRELFGDETADYQAAIDRHYAEGPPEDWEASYISTYATMHPFEDFAETWAHYLHICDALETGREFGLLLRVPRAPSAPDGAQIVSAERDPVGPDVSLIEGRAFGETVTTVWVPFAIALNQLNRSMGKDDVYPFVIPPPVLDKLMFVSTLTG